MTTRAFLPALASLTALLLVACAPERPRPPERRRPLAMAPKTYRCAGGEEVTAQYRPRSAVVTLPDGSSHTLPSDTAASGVRYHDSTLTWWTKGDSAFAMRGDSTFLRDCGIVPR